MAPEGRETIREKAQRLVSEGKLTRIHPYIYVVQGDTARYLTCVPLKRAAERAKAPVVASCTCEARGACSHMIGAEAIEKHIAKGGEFPTVAEVYRTRSGRVLTEADIERLADEAEQGHPDL